MGFGIGEPVRRKEDFRLVRGNGEFSDDLDLPGQAHAYILRSPHAHARLRGISLDGALRAPGVLTILTGADYLADGLRPIPNRPVPGDIPVKNRDSSPPFFPPDSPLVIDKVRHAGEEIAIVVAESRTQAKDAAELIEVDYEVLPALVDAQAALAVGAPAVWDEMPGNLCIDAELGNKAATDEAFARAAHVTRMDIRNNRVNAVPLEPRAALGDFDSATAKYTLYAGNQNVVLHKRQLAGALGVAEDKVRVVCRDVGGGFGMKNVIFREYVLVAWAAARLGRPVKWVCERSEAFLSDFYGRDLTSRAELAFDRDGCMIGMRTRNIANIGSQVAHLVPLFRGGVVSNGVYAIPAVHVQLQAVFTNTVPTSVYRGAGRPESVFIVERLIDMAAAEMGIDRIELRRRNIIPTDAIPYVNPMGTRYDSGEFDKNMEDALALARWADFPARREQARERGKLLGIGLSNYIETATGIPEERAVITVLPQRQVDVILGTQASGQGHETTFAQMIVEWLGVPFDDVMLRTGDTDFVIRGNGSHSSRSTRLAGLLLGRAANEIIAKGQKIAAGMLDADEADVRFTQGRFAAAGTNRSVDIFEVAAVSPGPLSAFAEIKTGLPNFPNGCHICEVEIDPATGAVGIVSYRAIDDCGRVINPMLVDGQIHGGIAQGVGQALMELTVYDAASGQLLSGSFMDYSVPRAEQFPFFRLDNNEVLAPNNPLGVKGAGEGGTTGAPSATINAVVDALREFAVRDVEMPATSERIWRAMNARGAS